MTNAVVKQSPKAKNLAKLINDMRPELAKALPKHITPERMARIAVTVVRQTPALANCSPESFLGALLTASQLGLEPGPTGEAYFVPYKQVCQFIPGYRGLIKLARNSGQVKDIYAEVIYENDKFEYTLGLNRTINEHTPPPLGQDRGKPVGAYAAAELTTGAKPFVVMTLAEIEAIRSRSMAANNGPWVSDWAEMAKKTVVRRLAKWLPLSAEFTAAASMDSSVRTDVGPLESAQIEFVDGEVVDDDGNEAEAPAEAPAGAPPPEPDTAAPQMASKEQLKRLAEIQNAEKYNDAEWFAFLAESAGVRATRAADLTFDEANRVLEIFDGPVSA
ncbi:RecT-like DNA pairing protein [Mycobacterium phage QueenHazel]|uniref:RecT-like DNA pairing protein n=1 Tax=Mycobacterium phage Xula TaxID=2599884 RepID=A0A5J6TK27_9CAUD|nr:RecT-like ssDNA annealing protein [Mycobacterium phage Xula]QFG11115.1 RecT-like DNA pairing protein [Mycobacterium phage Xula]QFG15051.1 RecT-like DNA pairing protein [Mycobacterium phage QueenHazel]